MRIEEALQVLERKTAAMPDSPLRDAIWALESAYTDMNSHQYIDREAVFDLMRRLCAEADLDEPDIIEAGQGGHLIGVRWGDVWLVMSPDQDQRRFLYVIKGAGAQMALGRRVRPAYAPFCLHLGEKYSYEAWEVAILAALPTVAALLRPPTKPVQPVAALTRIKAVLRAPVRSADDVGGALADVEALEAWCLSLAGLAMFGGEPTLDAALAAAGEGEE